MKKFIGVIISAVIMLCTALEVSAYEEIPIRFNSETVPMDGILVNGVTYVPFDRANEILSYGEAKISGDSQSMRSVTDNLTVNAEIGKPYTEAQDRYFGSAQNIEIDGKLYLPIRAIARAYETELYWRAESSSVDLYGGETSLAHGSEFYNEDDLYWLSRIISAEAGGESMIGKILVGNVVMNRVTSGEFPGSIREVIFDTKYGVQFTPTVNGTVYNAPTKDSIIAAKICLDSYYISRTALYFLNPVLATSFWIPANRPYLLTEGCHDFYA